MLWRSSAPRTPRKTLALAFVALATTGGLATAANANGLLSGLLGGHVPLLSSLLGSPAPATGNCSANGIVAVGAGALSNCSGSNSTAGGANCSAAGGIAVGAGALSNCSGSGSGSNCSSAGGIAVGAGVLSDCSGGSGQANCTGVGGISVSAAVLSDCSRSSATVSGDAAAAQYEEPGAECDGLLNAKLKLLKHINGLLVILPSFDKRILDLEVKIDALDTKIKACANLP